MTEQIEQKPVRKPARKQASRPARAAAIAAVAAASLVSGNASANAAANMNLGYEFLDEIRKAQDLESEPPLIDAETSAPMPSLAPPPSAPPRSATPGWATHRVPSASTEEKIEAERRLAEAERLYRGGRFDEALPAFRSIVDIDASHAHAWLRIGNLLHRKRDWFDALTAYRRAARPQADPVIREKAIYNVALLNLELARQALKRLERIRADGESRQDTGDAKREPAVSNRAVKQLSNQLGLSYDALSGVRQRAAPVDSGPMIGGGDGGRDGGTSPDGIDIDSAQESMTPHGAGARTAAVSLISVAPSSAAPAPGPRTPKPVRVEKPVQVEIHQGGGAQPGPAVQR